MRYQFIPSEVFSSKTPWLLFILFYLLITVSLPPPVNCAEPANVADYVQVQTSNEHTTLDRINRTLTSTVDITLTNTSSTIISFPLRAVIDILDTDYSNVEMPGALGGPGIEPYQKYYFEIGTTTADLASADFGRTNCSGNCPGDLDRDGDVDGYDLALLAAGNSFGPGRKITLHLTFIRPDTIRFRYNIIPYGVLEAGPINHPPVVNAGRPYSGIQGQEIAFDGSGCSDPDGDFIYFFWDFGDGQSSTEQSPVHVYASPGQYTVTLTVKDAQGASASAQSTAVVSRLNHAPVFPPIPGQETSEGTQLTIEINASDEDGDLLVYAAENLPLGAYFDSPTHTFKWTPGYDQAGTYTVTFMAADPEGLSASANVSITVNNTNRPPVIQVGGNRTIPETKQLIFTISGTDPDNDPISFSANSLPTGATFDPSIRTFSWTPQKGLLGTYNASFAVSDGQAQDSATVRILVIPFNPGESPVFSPVGDRTVKEGEAISFEVVATDPNNDPLVYEAANLPPQAGFDPSTRTFAWTPGFDRAGTYSVHFKAIDPGGLSDEMDVTIVVEDVNRPPKLEPAGPFKIAETKLLAFEITGADPDQDTLFYSVDAATLPQGAEFDASSRMFSWTPGEKQAGDYTVTFVISDGKDSVSEDVQITVVEFSPDHSPLLSLVEDKVVDEGAGLTFEVKATDPDNDTLTIEGAPLPQGASFSPDGARENTYIFSWTPEFDQSGEYFIAFTATDQDGNSDASNVKITVNNVNRAPSLAPVPDQSVEEGILLTVQASATDPDNDPISYSAQNLPRGASVDPQAGLLSWTPEFDQAGQYSIIVVASDGELSDQKTLNITVNDVNRAPVITTTQLPQGAIDQMYKAKIEAEDPDGDTLSYSLIQSTAPLTLDPSTGTLTWRPGISDVGIYNLTVAVNDGKGGTATKSYTLHVPDTIFPAISINAPKEGNPGTSFKAQVIASDNAGIATLEIDGEIIQFSEPFSRNMVQEKAITLPSKIGPVTIQATAVDTSGNRSPAQATVNVVSSFDTTPPQVELTAPPSAYPGQAILLTARMTDDNGVSEVTFYAGNASIGSPPVSSPAVEYTVPQDATQGSAIAFRVEAKDFSGNTASDQASTTVVAMEQADTDPPQTDVSTPEQAEPNEPIPVHVDTPNETCLARIDVYVNHTLAATYFAPDITDFEVPPPPGVEPGMDVLVEVVVTDCSGNQSTVTTDLVSIKEPGKGIIAGEVYDDTTGLALEQATVTVYQDNVPALSTQTDASGYFSLEVNAGPARVAISKEGFSLVERTGIEVPEQGGIEIYDARLTPISGESASLAPAVGAVLEAEFSPFRTGLVPALERLGLDASAVSNTKAAANIPAGAITTQQEITLTQISPQGLQGLLPAGWSPVGVIDLIPHGVSFQVPASLSVPNLMNLDQSQTLALVRWDEEAHAWRVIYDASLSADHETINGEINSTGQFAFVLADTAPQAPPSPVTGEILAGIARPVIPAQVSTTITPDPRIIFYRPGVRSEVGVMVSSSAQALSSGAPCLTVLREEYDFYSGAGMVTGPFDQDIFLFSMGLDALGATYTVTPSMEFEGLTLKKGFIHIDTIAPDALERDMNIIGPEGGTVALDTGHSIMIPPDALTQTIPVELETINENDPSIFIPEDFTFVRAVKVSFGGQDLASPAVLTAPIPGTVSPEGDFLLARLKDLSDKTVVVLVGRASVHNGTLTSVYNIAEQDEIKLPGVVSGGRYIFLKPQENVAYAAGTVFDTEGVAKPDALVTSTGISISSMTNTHGGYIIGVPVGAFTLTALDISKLDSGQADGNASEAGALVMLDIALVAEPPSVVEVTPANGSSNISLETSISLRFSEPVSPETVTESTIILTGPDGPVPGTISLAAGNTRVTFRAAEPLKPNTTYTITALTQIRDLAGYGLEAPFSSSFTSLDTSPPPPPPPAAVNATIPHEDGKTTVTGTQGTAGVHDTVMVINKTRNVSQPALVQPDGSFSTTIEAGLTDEIVISITDPAGNETVVPVGPFRDPDGSTVIGPQGGILEAENGVVLEIPEGAFPNGSIVKVTALAESDIPVSPGSDFPFVAAFEIQTSEPPDKYFNVSAPLPSPGTPANFGIVARLVRLYGGEPHLAIVDSAKVENGRLVTSSPPCPGVKGFYRDIYVMYLNMAANMINSFVKISFSVIGHFATGGGISSFAALTWDVLSELYDYTTAAIEIYKKDMTRLNPFVAAINGLDPYACMVIPPEEGFKAVVRDPDTREVIEYIDIDPIEPFGHAHFEFSVYKEHDVFGPRLASIEPVSRVLDSRSAKITLRFSEPVDHMNLLGAGEKDIYLTLKDNDSVYYTGTWELKEDNTVLVFKPHHRLPMGKSFILHMENLRDLAGNSYDGTNIEIKTYQPEVIFPTKDTQLNRAKIARDLGVSVDQVPDELWIGDLDYSTRGPDLSYDGRWHTDIIAIQYPDYEKSGWNTYRLFKIDATDPTGPAVSGAFRTDTRYTQTRVRFLDNALLPPRPDFQGDPWWERKVLVYNSLDPSINFCWDPQEGDQEIYNEWRQRHCDPGCDTITGGCGDLAVVTGYGTGVSGTSYSMLFPYEVADPRNISWIGWRFLSDAGYGMYTRSDVPVGVGYPQGLVLVPHMDITHGDKVHTDTIGAFVANYGVGLQLVDLGLNMPGIEDNERENQSLSWAPVERLHMASGSYFRDVALVPPRVRQDGSQVPARIAAIAFDQKASTVRSLQTFIPGQGDTPTGSKSLPGAPAHIAVAANVPVKDYDTNELSRYDLAVITFAGETGGGLFISEIPEDGSSPGKTQYIQLPVKAKFVDVDSGSQLAYVGASGIDQVTGGDGLLIVDISDPFNYVGDEDGDGWNDRVIGKVPLKIPSYSGSVSSWGLRIDPGRGLVYAAICAGGDQGLAIVKVNQCPDPGVDFKETGQAFSLPENLIKQGIEQVVRHAMAGSGIPEGSVAVVAYGQGACVWKGQCNAFADLDQLPYRFAVLIPEAQWDKKDLLINTLYAQVRDDATGGPRKVTLEGSDVFVKYNDIEFIPLKLEEFVKADLSIDYNDFDYGLARHTLLLEILLTGTYLDTIPGVNRSIMPLDIMLSSLSAYCSADECGTEEPSHLWRQEGYEIEKLALARFLKGGLLIRILGESETGTSLKATWKKDLKEAAGLALRAVLGHMIATEGGNHFITFRADTYGFPDTGIIPGSSSDPDQWDFEAGINSFEQWIATMAALSVRDNVGIFFPEDIVNNVFDFLTVYNGDKSFVTEQEANAFIAKCYNYIQQELEAIPWSVYHARLQYDPRASQRSTNMNGAEGAIIDFRANGKKELVPRFFNKGPGNGSHISVKMFKHTGGAWEQQVAKEIDLEGGSEVALPAKTFHMTGINQGDASGSAGWMGFTIDLPEKKMRDGDRTNNWKNIYYYVLDPASPSVPALPTNPGLPVDDPEGDMLEPVPECECELPEIVLTASINGTEEARLEPAECTDIELVAENNGDKALSNITIKTNLPGLEDWSYEIANLAAGASVETSVHFCAPEEPGDYRASFWFEESDPEYNLVPAYSEPLNISVVARRLHLDGKANAKDEVFVALGEEIDFSVSLGPQDPQDAEVIWDLGDGKGMSQTRAFTYQYEKAGTYHATVFGTSPQGGSGKDTVLVHVVELEILVNETLDDNVLVKDPGEIDDLVRLKAEFTDAEDPSLLPTRVFFTPCLIRLKTPLEKPVPMTVEAHQGKIGFAKQENASIQSGEAYLDLVVPKNGDAVKFFITGEQPSDEVDDARVLVWNRDKSSLFSDEDLTVFWFDDIHMDIVQGGIYQLTTIQDGEHKGMLLFEAQGSGTNSLGVLMKASATLKPDGISCEAPQIAAIRIGIVQNASEWQDIYEYSNPKPEWIDEGVGSVEVPATYTVTVSHQNIPPTQWLCDGTPEAAPLYHKCVTSYLACDNCGFDRPYLLNKLPFPCPGSQFQFEGATHTGTWNDDTPFSILAPTYPAEGFLEHKAPDGNTIARYRYEQVRVMRKEKFRCWAVTIIRKDADWSSCDECSPCSKEEKVVPLMENGWELDLDSDAVDASGQPDPLKRKAQVISPTGFSPRHAPVVGPPFPNDIAPEKTAQPSQNTTIINR